MNNQNHQKQAAALKYRQAQDCTPRLIAKGRNLTAQQILDIARKHGIPIIKHPSLLGILMSEEINNPIPVKVLGAVAEIYAFLIQLDEQYAPLSD